MLRPDERANQAQIERDQRFRSNVGKAAVTAGSIGAAAIGGPMAARIMPFLNQYIPASLAVQGINKVSPQIGKFLKRGESMGLDIKEGLQFLKDQLGGGQQQAQPETPKENRNVVEQYSPELHQFMSQRVKGGEDPVRAAAMALFEKGSNFEPIIRKIEKEHKTNWSQLVQSIYGGGEGPGQAPPAGDTGLASIGKGMASGISDNFYQQSFDALKNGSTVMGGINDPFLQVAKQFFDKGQIQSVDDLKRLGQQYFQQKQQQQGQQQGQPQGGGQGNQALMSILQKINQRLGQ